MSRAHRKHRSTRKKIYVDPAVQGALLRRLMLHWVYAIATAFVCLLAGQIFSGAANQSATAVLTDMWQRYGSLLIILVLVFPLFAYDALRMSHRFVGPIYAVRLALRKLANGGDIPEVSFRKNDYWADLAGDLNQIARQLREARQQATSDTDGQPASEQAEQASDEDLNETDAATDAEDLVSDVQDYLRTIQLSDEDLGLSDRSTIR